MWFRIRQHIRMEREFASSPHSYTNKQFWSSKIETKSNILMIFENQVHLWKDIVVKPKVKNLMAPSL
jgi:hypothetical protein